jgi:hypothetical protein
MQTVAAIPVFGYDSWPITVLFGKRVVISTGEVGEGGGVTAGGIVFAREPVVFPPPAGPSFLHDKRQVQRIAMQHHAMMICNDLRVFKKSGVNATLLSGRFLILFWCKGMDKIMQKAFPGKYQVYGMGAEPGRRLFSK